MSVWIIFLGIAGYGTWFVLNECWRAGHLRSRHDHRVLWMAAVPPNDRSRVDELLSAICDAFMIPLHYRFRLRPSDELQALYRRNMQGQFGDSLEYENLAIRLEEILGLDVERLFAEQPCTVGTLVRSATKPRNNKTTEPVAPPPMAAPQRRLTIRASQRGRHR
jgi:hypothetical protein